jgi:putative SOS response-associated peptidase YedK
MWREAFENRRCLIPVSGYYEYTGPAGGKQAHLFTASGDDWLWAAGIWEENSELGRCYSMIMTAANAFVSAIHHRMPALLAPDAMEPWLAGEILSLAPSSVDLAVAKAANPLKRKPDNTQGELF